MLNRLHRTLAVAAVACLPSVTIAQETSDPPFLAPSGTLVRITDNPDFTGGFQGWNGDNAVASIIAGGVEGDGQGTDQQAQLEVVGSYSQWDFLDAGDDRHVVSLFAAVSPNAEGEDAFAVYGVTYFNEAGEQVGVSFRPIGPPAGGGNSGLQPYSLGSFVPGDAVVAVIWVYNGAETGTLRFDDFALYSYRRPRNDNLLTSGLDVVTSEGAPRAVNGAEFLIPGDGFDPSGQAGAIDIAAGPGDGPQVITPQILLGRSGSDTSAWQPVFLSDRNYRLRIAHNNAVDGASAGIDFFNEAGEEISEVILPLTSTSITPAGGPIDSAPALDFSPPAGATGATFWIYVPSTDTPLQISALSLTEIDDPRAE